MAEKSGVFNGISIGLTGKNKQGRPYTIYNVDLMFPSGKSFKLNVPSWGDVYKDIKDLPVGTGIKCEVDERNNITEFKVTAPVNAPAPPVPPATPAQAGTIPVEKNPEKNSGELVLDPVARTAYEYTEQDLRVRALELAIDFYKDATGTKKDLIATEELVFSMAKRIYDFMRPSKPTPTKGVDKPMGPDPTDEPNYDGPPPAIDEDDIPY